nr:hypothetical protein [Tanacetum cinerariifolium]
MDEEREAITTGLQNLWPQVPNSLVFKHVRDDKDVSLIEFFSYVDKTLTQRSHLSVKYILLYTDYGIKFKSQVNNLIRYAISCNVQQFWLVLSHIDEDKESNDLFEINSEPFFVNSCFTYLYVEECVFNPSCTLSWINLRSLCINYGKFDEVLIQNILSGSPLLETLVIDNCNGFRRIDITSNSVKNFVFSGSMHLDDELEDVGNIITINAPHILSLKMNEEFGCKLMLLNVSSLVKAYLDYKMDIPNKEHEEDDMLARFILSLRHVKEFKIGKDCLKIACSGAHFLKSNDFKVLSNFMFHARAMASNNRIVSILATVAKTSSKSMPCSCVGGVIGPHKSPYTKSKVNSAGRPNPAGRIGKAAHHSTDQPNPAGWSKRPAPVSAGRP